MFWVMKFIQEMFFPLPLFFGFSLLALVLFLRKKEIIARVTLVAAFVFLLFFSYDVGQNYLIRPLEGAIPIYNPKDFPNVKTVVVLGGGKNPNSDRPVTAILSQTSLVRLVEGVRVFNLTDANNLILTGADVLSDISIAAAMKECAVDLGIDESRIITIDRARNTREEAKYTAEFVRGDSVFLVSSATHLKRAKKNFEREGILVVPIATDFILHNYEKLTIWHFFPSPTRITNSGKAIREHLGLLYEIFR
jgi:uncharacterized SAM-binding protein YcdF (DUF218 family)